MGSQSIDYKAVILDIENKRAQMNARFDAALTALRQVMSMDEPEPQLSLPGVAAGDKPYAGKSMLDAAMKHLSQFGPVANVPLAKALEERGYKHKSQNFPNTLNSVLWRRAKTVGDLQKTVRGWAIKQPSG